MQFAQGNLSWYSCHMRGGARRGGEVAGQFDVCWGGGGACLMHGDGAGGGCVVHVGGDSEG